MFQLLSQLQFQTFFKSNERIACQKMIGTLPLRNPGYTTLIVSTWKHEMAYRNNMHALTYPTKDKQAAQGLLIQKKGTIKVSIIPQVVFFILRL